MPKQGSRKSCFSPRSRFSPKLSTKIRLWCVFRGFPCQDSPHHFREKGLAARWRRTNFIVGLHFKGKVWWRCTVLKGFNTFRQAKYAIFVRWTYDLFINLLIFYEKIERNEAICERSGTVHTLKKRSVDTPAVRYPCLKSSYVSILTVRCYELLWLRVLQFY